MANYGLIEIRCITLIRIGGIKTSAYNGIYRAVYDLHKRYMPCPVTMEQWEAAARDFGETSSKYSNDQFAIDMLIAVYSELERQWETMHRKEGQQ